MSKEIIVTGSRGRLATILRAHFEREKQYRVHAFSRSQGEGHLLSSDMFTSGILERAEVILHLAWSTTPLISEQKPGLEWQIDLPRLARLLEEIDKGKLSEKLHFIFFSSGGTVYGNAPGRPSRESDPLEPRGWHGSGKVAAEYLINRFSVTNGLRCTILRLSNPFGIPSSDLRPQGVIPLMIRAAHTGERFRVWGDGHARKDFLYHTDMIRAVEAIMEKGLLGTFNVSAGQSYSLREVAARIEDLLGRRLSLDFGSTPPWDVTVSELNNSLLREKTGWKPVVSLDEGLKLSVRALGVL